MGIFRKVGDWLTEKSDHFIRGDASSAGGYYGSREAEQTYGGMDARDAEGDETEEQVGVDPFGHGGGEYGGRVPYRSRYDIEREAAQQQAQQQPVSQPPQQPVASPMQQTMRQQPIVNAQTQQQPTYAYGAQQPYAQQPAGNVVPFPGMQQSTEGGYYAHVEYVVSIHSRNECKDVIVFMKANASVFLNMEFIASDGERQRCVDLLSGAAYTLGCKLNKISLRGIYLISSPSVHVILDGATQRLSGAQEAQGFARQRYDQPPYGGYATEQRQPPRQQPVTGFSSGSPTTRFQAQGTQRNPPVSFGNVMTGNPNDNGYAGGQGGYAAQTYASQR